MDIEKTNEINVILSNLPMIELHFRFIHSKLWRYPNLKTDYISLKTDYISLKTYYISLKTDYLSLKTDYISLKTDHIFLKTDYISLKTDYFSDYINGAEIKQTGRVHLFCIIRIKTDDIFLSVNWNYVDSIFNPSTYEPLAWKNLVDPSGSCSVLFRTRASPRPFKLRWSRWFQTLNWFELKSWNNKT